MEKSKTIFIGTGGCGNNILDELLSLDGRYTGIFANTNIKEMQDLKHFNRERNVFFISNANGTGRNREKVIEFIKEDQPKFIDFLTKFSTFETFTIITSADGGTGSGSTGMFAKAIKKLYPESVVNIVGVLPSLYEGEDSMKNTIGFWNDIMTLRKKGIINSIHFADNNKFKSEKQMNKKIAQDIHDSFSVNNIVIDDQDSKRVNNCVGYKVVLRLNPNIPKLEDAIDQAIQDSVFIQPSSYDCNVLMATFDEDSYNKDNFRGKFNVLSVDKYDYNDEDRNIIVLGGCKMPNEAIELIELQLKEIEKKKKALEDDEDLIIDIGNSKPRIQKNKNKITPKDIKDMLSDDNFWDD